MFTREDGAHAALWLLFSYWQVAHRTPWGLWTTAQRTWYRRTRRQLGGPSEHVWGTLWLFSHGIMGIGLFATFRHADALQSLYWAAFVLALAHLVLEKVWKTLFWDYRDSLAAAWVGGASVLTLGGLFGVSVAMSVQLVPRVWPWVGVGCLAAMLVYSVYTLALSVHWARFTALSRKDARNLHIE